MNRFIIFPDQPLTMAGVVSDRFLKLGVNSFRQACRYVAELPYGYNSDDDDLLVLFKENRGTGATKHAVIAALAGEIGLPVNKSLGIYALTENIVSGADEILKRHALPYLPMPHYFLSFAAYRVDLTEDNVNGINQPINEFLFTTVVAPANNTRMEYLLYQEALLKKILIRPEMQYVFLKTVMNAQTEGLQLLKSKLIEKSEHRVPKLRMPEEPRGFWNRIDHSVKITPERIPDLQANLEVFLRR